jgi:iron complex outermembrane receptor protein
MAQKRLSILRAGCALAIGVAAPALAFAQDSQSEEIVVTATHRESSIQDVPFSVNAQTQEDIERTGSTSLEDLSRNVAGMSVQNLGPGQSQVALRGVSAGQIVRDQPGVKEQVGVYLDDSVISLSLFTPDLDLYDLNRVETLRGPQGTLFGSGSVGGTIRYITNRPDLDNFEGSLEGSLNTIDDGGPGGHLKGMVNMPLVEGVLGARLVGYYTEYGGFIDALHEDGSRSDDVNDGSRAGLRASLAMQLTPNLLVTPRVVYQSVESHGFNRQEVFNVFANPYMTTPVVFDEREQLLRLEEEFSDETTIADVTVNWDLGAVDFTSVTSFINRNILVSRDASALTGSVSIDLAFQPAAFLLPSNLRDTTDLQQFTQEVRLASDYDSPFQWLVGAFFSDVDREYHQRLPTPGYDVYTDIRFGAGTAVAVANGFPLDSPYNADLPYDIEQFALFGEASYDITERFTITAGGRWYDFNEERRFTSGGLFSNGDDQVDTTSSDGFNPRVIASYEINENLTLNAQAAQGFRLGGANDPLNLGLCDGGVPGGPDALTFGGHPTYDDETLWNYEGGFKYTNGNMTLNAAAYHSDIDNLQVTADAGSCSSRVVFNAAAHTTGLEAEFSISPMAGLEVSFAGSWVEAEFDETRLSVLGDVLAGIREGNRLPSVPEYQLAATAAYYFPLENWSSGLEGFVVGTVQHMGSRYTQPADQEPGAGVFTSGLPFGGATGAEVTTLDLELEPFTIINLNAGVQTDVWGLTFFVNNVADENANLAFDRERGGRARLGFHTNQPRTYGVTLRRMFN